MKLKTKDIKTIRDSMLKEQGGIDPIANVTIIDPCLDHCHQTGVVRGVLDRRVNSWEGKVKNSFARTGVKKLGADYIESLKRLIVYLEADRPKIIHPMFKTLAEKKIAMKKKSRNRRKKSNAKRKN
jgi:hypothetical protein